MSDLPHMPLFVDDFEAATAHLTAEEDGIYNRLLRLCWRTPGCKIPTDPAWIARRLRVSMADYERVVAPLLDEFFNVQAMLFYQKRLLREYERATMATKKRKEAGSTGGKAKSLKTAKNAPSNATSGLVAETKQCLVSRSISISNHIERDFETFWGAYPQREGANPRSLAKSAFSKAIASGASADEIVSGAKAYAAQQRKEHGAQKSRFTAQAATWLNQRRWEDGLPAATGAGSKPTSRPLAELTREDWQKRLDYCRPRNEWLPTLGPKPFDDGCLVPADMLVDRDRQMTLRPENA